MRLTLISPESCFDPAGMATGLQWRMDQLARGLTAAGIDVRRVDLGPENMPYETDLTPHLADTDAVLCGYWQLLEQLPDNPGIPVLVDCVAPRPLEVQFSDPEGAAAFTARYRRALTRADLLLAGNRRQRWLLTAWLADAGADLTDEIPVVVAPLAAEPGPATRTPPASPLVLVTGGREWPWRRTGRWLDALADSLDPARAELHVFGNRAPAGAHGHPFLPWRQWQAFLEESAHIGLELADRNPEREFSQSYRITACLQAGLPVIVNDYLEIAEAVRRHEAGWTVASPGEAVAAVRQILEEPSIWQRRARGARKLAGTELALDHTLAELVHWLETPRRRSRRNLRTRRRVSVRKPMRSLTGRLARFLLAPFRRRIEGSGVVVTTRSDLFPADHGAAVKILETARALARCGRRVALVTGDRAHWWEFDADGPHRRNLPLWLRLTALPRRVVHLVHRLRGWPRDSGFMYWPLIDPGYGLRAARVGRHIGAGVYLAEFPGYGQAARMARYLNGGIAVMAEHNVEFKRLKEQHDDLADRQYARLRAIELQQAACMNAVVCVSESDRRILVEHGMDSATTTVIPHGVALDDYAVEPTAPAELGLDPDLPTLVYHGTYAYPPNAEALEILVEALLPRLEAAGRPCQVLAIGSKPPKIIGQPRLHTPGSLTMLAPALRACDIAVVPLISGGGTRMKLLDYFAAGLPVVATAKGCEGLPVRDGRDLIVCDDWDDMTAAIMRLLDEPAAARALGAAGRAFAETLDWSEIGKRYDALFRDLVENGNRKS